MRDAARELADALQPLRLREALLELLALLLGAAALGDVRRDRADAADLAFAVEQRELDEHELALGLVVARAATVMWPSWLSPVRSTSRSRSSLVSRREARTSAAARPIAALAPDAAELLPAAVDEHVAQLARP